MDKNQVFDEYR